MIQKILTGIIILAVLVYYHMVVKPRRIFSEYVKNIQKLGYKPLVIPFQPFGVPFIQIFKEGEKQGDSMKFAKENYKNYDVLVTNFFNKIFINFIHPDFIKDFYSVDNQFMYPKLRNLMSTIKRALGQGIFLSEGQIWKRKRKIISSNFNFDFIKSMTFKIKYICSKSIQKLQEKSELIQCNISNKKHKAYEYKLIESNMLMFSTIIIECFLGGVSQHILDGQEISIFVNNLIADLNKQGIQKRIIVLGPGITKLGLTKIDNDINRRVAIFKQWVMSNIGDKIRETKLKIQIQGQKFCPSDLVQVMVVNSFSQNDHHHYTQAQIFEEFSTFLVAGTDTTSHFTLMMLYYLSLNPHSADKVRQEVQKYMKNDDFSYQNLKNFTYIDKVQKQTGRLYGIGHNIFPRNAKQDNYINGLPIRKGTVVSIVQTGSHYSQKYFKNPLQFRPQRWQTECQNLPPYAYNIFSGGARTCIGKHLAMLQNKIALIIYFKRYKQIILPTTKINMSFKFVYSPDYLTTKQVIE